MRTRSKHKSMWLALSLLLVLVGTAVAGCAGLGGGGGDTTYTTVTTAPGPGGPSTTLAMTSTTGLPTTTTVAPVPGPTPTTISTAEEVLPSGNIRAMGYITAVWVDGGVRYIRINYVTMLTGAEADAAAIAAGEIPPGEHVPNDYYIDDVSPKLRTWSVSGSAAITTSTRMSPHDGFGVTCTWSDFVSFWDSPPPAGDSHMHAVPWWIERDGDTVVSIEEQYIP